MARPKKAREPVDNGSMVPVKDFKMALKLFMEDIRPAESKVGEFAQQMSNAFKAIKKTCHIQPAAAKLAFKLIGMEESKRDDFWRSLNGMCDLLEIGPQPDLVDAMSDNKGPAPVVASRPKPQLVTLSDGKETDLADGAPYGSGAAAMAAMKAAQAPKGEQPPAN